MRITWLGHSCFKVEKDGFTVILDPYRDGSVPGLADIRETAGLVLCSHEHGDHNGRECVTLVSGKDNPFEVTQISSFHDDAQGSKRGKNLITLLDDGKEKLVHLGDLGCEPEPEQIQKIKNPDVLLIPVGGFFTIDAKQAAELVARLQPKKVIPMHYRDDETGFGFDVIAPVSAFTKLMDTVRTVEGSVLDTDAQYDAQVIVLQPQKRLRG